jgi:hypothetical protein
LTTKLLQAAFPSASARADALAELLTVQRNVDGAILALLDGEYDRAVDLVARACFDAGGASIYLLRARDEA